MTTEKIGLSKSTASRFRRKARASGLSRSQYLKRLMVDHEDTAIKVGLANMRSARDDEEWQTFINFIAITIQSGQIEMGIEALRSITAPPPMVQELTHG